MKLYRCDECGACCRHHIIEADLFDAIREPKIAERAKLLDGHGKIPLDDASFSLAVCDPCVFMDGNRCSIYSSRPSVCVSYAAGGMQCQEARQSEGLPPLMASEVENPTLTDRIAALNQAEHDANYV